jgi:uncharacterized damage-inducible protein DinB
MKKANWLLGATLALACGSFAAAKDAGTIATVLDKNITSVEKEVVPAAEAMPEDKYTFVPTGGEFKGVRSFAAQVKHIAAVNYVIAAAILGEKPPVDTGEEAGPASMTSKADIVKFLKDSFAYSHKATLSLSDADAVKMGANPFGKDQVPRMSVPSWITGHCFDHYGQMVVYLRLNGIVPPASR